MQILQIQQILPQAQAQTGSQNVELVKPVNSFADELKAAENRSKTPDENKTVGRTEDSASEKTKTDGPEKLEKRETKETAQISETENDTSDKKVKTLESTDQKEQQFDKTADETLALIENQNLIASRMISSAEEKNEPAADVHEISLSDEESISETKIRWLFTAQDEKTAASETETSEDFAKLLENAGEFVPGNESETEKLENAQNLSTNDPSAFLSKAQIIPDTDGKMPEEADSVLVKQGAEGAKEKKSPFRLEIKDYRTEKPAQEGSENAVAAKTGEKKFMSSYAEKGSSESNNELTMELMHTVQQNTTSSNAQAAGSTGSTFQNQLAQAVQENAPEFVKAGTIVLKDNNKGAINLILHPESLGNVKVHLSLSDKLITGTINVQSREAYEAFKESISSIKEAFAQSGFETGSFDLSFSDGSQGQFAQNQNSDSSQMSQFMGRTAYGDFVTPQQLSEGSEEQYFEQSPYGVNIVA